MLNPSEDRAYTRTYPNLPGVKTHQAKGEDNHATEPLEGWVRSGVHTASVENIQFYIPAGAVRSLVLTQTSRVLPV